MRARQHEHHAVDDERRELAATGEPSVVLTATDLVGPCGSQPRDIRWCDLRERGVPRPHQIAVVVRPVAGRRSAGRRAVFLRGVREWQRAERGDDERAMKADQTLFRRLTDAEAGEAADLDVLAGLCAGL